jgi:hypothetical protein
VSESDDGPAGVLVLHLWTETGDRMRVRVTRTTDVASEESTTSYASTPAEVLALVERWLEALVTRR